MFDRSVEATRRSRDGATLWEIADALLDEVEPGESRDSFRRIIAECESVGIEPFSVSAMRQYRDVAARYGKSDRIDGISFSAHRAAMPSSDPLAILRRLAKAHGNRGVTVAKVKAAVAVELHGINAVVGTGNGTGGGNGHPNVQSNVSIHDFDSSALVGALIDRTRRPLANGTLPPELASMPHQRKLNWGLELEKLCKALTAAGTAEQRKANQWADSQTATEPATEPATATEPAATATAVPQSSIRAPRRRGGNGGA